MDKKNKQINKTKMKFTTTTDTADIYFEWIELDKFLKNKVKLDFIEIESVTGFAKIDWEFYLETREWGIKNFGAYATGIKINLHLEYCKTDSEDTIDFCSKEILLKNYIKDFKIISETDIEQGDRLTIGEIEINFEAESITIVFN